VGRASRKKRERRKQAAAQTPQGVGAGDDGIHAIVPAIAPAREMEDAMTAEFQRNIRKSPLWDDMVRQYGEQKAEELLKKCRAKVQ
jgi:hypothetical protein